MLVRRGGGGGGHRSDTVLRVGILAQTSKIQNLGPLPVSGRFAAEGHSIRCLSGPEGGGGACS